MRTFIPDLLIITPRKANGTQLSDPLFQFLEEVTHKSIFLIMVYSWLQIVQIGFFNTLKITNLKIFKNTRSS